MLGSSSASFSSSIPPWRALKSDALISSEMHEGDERHAKSEAGLGDAHVLVSRQQAHHHVRARYFWSQLRFFGGVDFEGCLAMRRLHVRKRGLDAFGAHALAQRPERIDHSCVTCVAAKEDQPLPDAVDDAFVIDECVPCCEDARNSGILLGWPFVTCAKQKYGWPASIAGGGISLTHNITRQSDRSSCRAAPAERYS